MMEANPEETESVVVHEEVPTEEVAMKTFGALKKQYLVVGRRRKPKKRIQDNCVSRKKLAATCRGIILHCVRDTVVRSKSRTRLYQESRKDGR
jgi:hypothetical protein